MPPKEAAEKPEPEKSSVKISEKAGERMREVSDKMINKIRSAKKSANLSLDFDPKKLEIYRVINKFRSIWSNQTVWHN